MRAIGIIQARLSSTRLPAKILAPIAGRPLLALLAARVMSARRVDEWWLATSDTCDDDITAAWGAELGLEVYRGALDDVLSRFVAVTERRRPDVLVRLTADDPFTDAAIVDRLVEQLAGAPQTVAVVGEAPTRHHPLGYCPQAARGAALLRLSDLIPADQPHHRAHVLSWFYTCEGACAGVRPAASWPARPAWRWTVDTARDLAMARSAFLTFDDPVTVGYEAMVRALDARPEITALNLDVAQKALEDG